MSNQNIRDSLLKINTKQQRLIDEYKLDIESLVKQKITLQKLTLELENENLELHKKIKQYHLELKKLKKAVKLLKKELQEEKEWC